MNDITYILNYLTISYTKEFNRLYLNNNKVIWSISWTIPGKYNNFLELLIERITIKL